MGQRRHLALALALLTACGDDEAGGARIDAAARGDANRAPDARISPDGLSPTCDPIAGTDLVLEPLVDGLVQPVFIGSAPGDPRMFVVEQAGVIRIVRDGALVAEPFLDISGRVLDEGHEQGLLGLAFHPDWANNRRFFVYYTAASGTPYFDRVSEFAISSDDPDRADPDSERLVIELPDPHLTHNGGGIAFGPDRYLYIGFGDGGGPGDPGNDAQDPTSLLGHFARIDVDSAEPYAIPDDNPYADGAGGARPEIWLSGVRNPWRWSFDRVTGEMYIGDVGQSTREEVSLIPAGQSGLNLGWNDMEGDLCYDNPDCLTAGYHAPIATYANEVGPPCRAVVGGYVYRGACYPDLVGWYFYADYCNREVRVLEVEDGILVAGPTDVTDDIDPASELGQISSFGQDATGELYVVTRNDGRVLHIAAQP